MVPGSSAFDRYSKEVLRLHRRIDPLHNLILLRRVDSTQRLGRRFVRVYLEEEEPVPEATLVAYEQTAGRGRKGRSWASPPGIGAYVTLVRSIVDGPEVSRLPLLAGVALVAAVDRWVEGKCRLKWPNDLMVSGRKIGGILIDAISRPGQGTVAVLGFGVNRGRRGSPPPVPEATALAQESARPPTLARLTHGLLESLWELWPRLGDPAWLVDRYRRVSAHRPGERLTFRGGGSDREGVFRGFDSQGQLLLDTGDAVEALSSGELLAGSKRKYGREL